MIRLVVVHVISAERNPWEAWIAGPFMDVEEAQEWIEERARMDEPNLTLSWMHKLNEFSAGLGIVKEAMLGDGDDGGFQIYEWLLG